MTPDLEALVGGRYRLGPPVGRGAFGTVLRVFDRRDEAWRALKFSGDVARLRREHAALERVSHPCVVRVHDWRASPALAFLTMDLAEGVDALEHVRGDLALRGVGKDAGRRNLPRAFGLELQAEGRSAYTRCSESGLARLRSLGRALAAGLGAIHRTGLLHLDVRPENVRVDGTRTLLLDLGLALDRETPVTGEAYAGTPGYLAPELAHGRAGPATDIYSLGVLLFEALTGQRPFEGGGVEVLVRKQTLEAPRAHEVTANVPPELDALLGAMLSRRPEGRPTTTQVAAHL